MNESHLEEIESGDLIDHTRKGLGAEHLVDTGKAPDNTEQPKTCGECPLYVGGCDGYVHADNPAPCGTGKTEVVKESEEQADPVLRMIDAAFSKSEKLSLDEFLEIGPAINDIRTAYLTAVTKREDAHKKQVDSLFRDIRALEKESWERGESLSFIKEHLKNAEKRIAALEAELKALKQPTVWPKEDFSNEVYRCTCGNVIGQIVTDSHGNYHASMKDKYCSRCGARLDWSEDEGGQENG